MQNLPLQILVVENEYLIAMDAERILSDAFDCVVTIVTLKSFRTTILEQKFDIVLLDFGYPPDPTLDDLASILSSGAKLVFTTAYDGFATGIPDYAENPVVMKPYEDEQLSDAVKLALGTETISRQMPVM